MPNIYEGQQERFHESFIVQGLETIDYLEKQNQLIHKEKTNIMKQKDNKKLEDQIKDIDVKLLKWEELVHTL